MKLNRKISLVTSLVLFFTTPILSTSSVENFFIDVSEGLDAITLTSEEMTLIINEYKPDFIWWLGNESSAVEEYCVRFTTLQEFFGSDNIIDSSDELNGINYDLQTSVWDTEITELLNSVIVNLTLAGLANNVIIQFLVSINVVSTYLPGTNLIIQPFSEAKIEIVIKNWKFSDFAQGLALKAEICERKKESNISFNNGSVSTNENAVRSIQIFSDDFVYNPEKAFFRWMTSAEYYNGTDLLFDLPSGNAYFNETTDGYNDDYVNLWFSYQNYADSLTVKHTATLGLYEDEPHPATLEASVFSLSFLISLIVVNIITFIIYRKKVRKI